MRRVRSLVAVPPLTNIVVGTHQPGFAGARGMARLAALCVCALAWGLVDFGLLLWLPADLVAHGYTMGVSSKLLAQSALIACPTVFLAALLYSRWSSKWSLVTMIGVTLLGLILIVRLQAGIGGPVLPIAMLIVGTNGIIATVSPYAAESFSLGVRGRATGLVAACTKVGGLLAQSLSIMGLVPSIGVTAIAIMVPTSLALSLIAWFGIDTKGRDLRDLEPRTP